VFLGQEMLCGLRAFCVPSFADMELKDRCALLTGAKRIGAVVAEELAKRGVNVAL